MSSLEHLEIKFAARSDGHRVEESEGMGRQGGTSIYNHAKLSVLDSNMTCLGLLAIGHISRAGSRAHSLLHTALSYPVDPRSRTSALEEANHCLRSIRKAKILQRTGQVGIAAASGIAWGLFPLS